VTDDLDSARLVFVVAFVTVNVCATDCDVWKEMPPP